jgi:TorA maturation chaperone TorD
VTVTVTAIAPETATATETATETAPRLNARARQALYAFFSRLFVRELDDEARAAVDGPLGRELLPEHHREGGPRPTRDELDADFAHITVVDLVPYESFYRRDDGMVHAGGENPVARFLRDYGFEVDLAAARALAPDHLGIELEAMALLCGAEAEAEERPDPAYAAQIRRVERAFLDQHLLTWCPVYLFAVERAARTALYREAARAAMDFIAADAEALA